MAHKMIRKGRLIGIMVSEIRVYEARFHRPMQMRFISALYNKMFQNLGGFQETMLELEEMGDIEIIRTQSGVRFVRTTEEKWAMAK